MQGITQRIAERKYDELSSEMTIRQKKMETKSDSKIQTVAELNDVRKKGMI